MGTLVRNAVAALAAGVALSCLSACGGSGDPSTGTEAVSASLRGPRVAGRDDALRIASGGVQALLACSRWAHALLTREFERRASLGLGAAMAGERWVIEGEGGAYGSATVEIETVEGDDGVEGLMLRGEPGRLRAVLSLANVWLRQTRRIDGAIALDVSRAAAGAAAERRSRADALALSDGARSLRWSYLDTRDGAGPPVLSAIVALPADGGDELWLDIVAVGRGWRASGVIGWLDASLQLQIGADGGWTIEVDNDKDDRVDFVVHASPDEARRASDALMAGC